VARPLLGADFLAHHHLLVDVANQRLVDTDSFTLVPLHVVSPTETVRIHLCQTTDPSYDAIINEFSSVFKQELHPFPGTAAKHGIFHHIKTTGPPVHSKFRRLHPDRNRIAKAAFEEMEKMGICSKAVRGHRHYI
jgi:hypothetical protein